MERLTARDGKSAYFPHCFKMCEGFPHGCEKCHFVEEICECLAAYEDSGLSPENITELNRRAATENKPLTSEERDADELIRMLIADKAVNPCEWCRTTGKGGETCKGCFLYEDSNECPSKFTAFSDVSENKPLTLEQLRQMDGEPVWIVEAPDWGHWELSERAEDYLDDRDPDFYGMKHDDPAGRYGLHVLGWLAYARRPEDVPSERSGKP